jgi:Chaperone of endosialidase
LSDETSEVAITLGRLRLGGRSIPNSQWPSLTATGANQLTVGGSLSAQSLGVAGDITLNGSLSAGGDLSGRNLSITGALSAPNATIIGDINLNGSLKAGGDLSGRNLSVTGALSAPNATINGALSVGGSLVVGSGNPQAKLQVKDGAIMPSVGNSPQAGIQFPPDPGGGSGDEAFIRYFVTAGETTKLLIGTGNDLGDSIGLVQAGAERLTVVNGNVGIGTMTPTCALDVKARNGIRLGLGGNGGGQLILANNAGDNKIYLEAFSADGNGSAAELLLTGRNVEPIPIIKLIATTTQIIGDLHVTGAAIKPGGGSWGNSSDLRLKRKIEPLTGALEKLLQLRGVCFEWVEPEKMGNQHGLQRGLIAQEVESVFPEWISAGADGYKLLSIIGFEALMIEALRELKSEIESLKSQRADHAGKRPSRSERNNR